MENTVEELNRNEEEIGEIPNYVTEIKCRKRPEKMEYMPNFTEIGLENF